MDRSRRRVRHGRAPRWQRDARAFGLGRVKPVTPERRKSPDQRLQLRSVPRRRDHRFAERRRRERGLLPEASFADDSLEGWFKANGTEAPWSPPGAVFNYSNLGFALAGLAIQRATQTPFGSLVEQRVFAKAAIARATMSTEQTETDGDFAYGHSEGAAFAPTGAYFQMGQYEPMGGAWESAADLAAFGKALATRSTAVMPTAAWQAMVDAKGKTTWPGQSYGYGLILDEGNSSVQSHDGSSRGFSSSMMIVAGLGIGVFTVANGESIDGATLTGVALEALGSKPGAPPAPPSGSPADWVGTYQDPVRLGTVTIAKVGSGYSATWKGATRALSLDYGDAAF